VSCLLTGGRNGILLQLEINSGKIVEKKGLLILVEPRPQLDEPDSIEFGKGIAYSSIEGFPPKKSRSAHGTKEWERVRGLIPQKTARERGAQNNEKAERAQVETLLCDGGRASLGQSYKTKGIPPILRNCANT